MKVIVTGASGLMSLSALLYLLEQKDVSQIIAADIQEDKVKERVDKLGDKRLVPKFIDLSDVKSSAEVFKGSDVVVNCAYQGHTLDKAYPDFELLSTKAALEAGVNWIGLGGAPPSAEHLEPALSEAFKRKGLLAILGMGGGTGLVQVLAVYAIKRLDRTDSVDMYLGYKDVVPPEEHSRPLHQRLTVGAPRAMFTQDSFVYEKGKLLHFPPRSNLGKFTFGEPIGTLTVASAGGGAVPMLARSFPEIKHIDFKHYVESDMKFLAGLGLFSDEPIDVRGQKVSPWAVLQALLERLPPETKKAPEIHSEVRVSVKGEENKHTVEYDLMVRPSPEGNKKYLEKGCSPGFRTGICIGLAGAMVGREQVKEKGVLPPELCIPPDLYLEEFSKAGFEVKINRREIL